MPTTSLTLLERIQLQALAGLQYDNAAWQRLVGIYTPFLYCWCLRAGLNATESEDVVQEVFAVLLIKLPAFERQRDGSFRKWLQVVTFNKCRQHFRKKQVPVLGGGFDSDPLDQLADATLLMEYWESEYRQQLVKRAMEIMQAEFSTKVWQSAWEHLVQARPASEVAREFGLTANAVRVYSSRVLARLRTELRDLLDD